MSWGIENTTDLHPVGARVSLPPSRRMSQGHFSRSLSSRARFLPSALLTRTIQKQDGGSWLRWLGRQLQMVIKTFFKGKKDKPTPPPPARRKVAA